MIKIKTNIAFSLRYSFLIFHYYLIFFLKNLIGTGEENGKKRHRIFPSCFFFIYTNKKILTCLTATHLEEKYHIGIQYEKKKEFNN